MNRKIHTFLDLGLGTVRVTQKLINYFTFAFLTNYIFLEGQFLCDSIIQIFKGYGQLVHDILALPMEKKTGLVFA